MCRFEGLTREGIPHGKGVLVMGNGTGGGFHQPGRGDRYILIGAFHLVCTHKLQLLVHCHAGMRESLQLALHMGLECTQQLMVRCTEGNSCMAEDTGMFCVGMCSKYS